MVLIKNQEDLDQAVQLVDRNERMRSLRVFLMKIDNSSGAPPGKLGELFDNNIHDKSTVSTMTETSTGKEGKVVAYHKHAVENGEPGL